MLLSLAFFCLVFFRAECSFVACTTQTHSVIRIIAQRALLEIHLANNKIFIRKSFSHNMPAYCLSFLYFAIFTITADSGALPASSIGMSVTRLLLRSPFSRLFVQLMLLLLLLLHSFHLFLLHFSFVFSVCLRICHLVLAKIFIWVFPSHSLSQFVRLFVSWLRFFLFCIRCGLLFVASMECAASGYFSSYEYRTTNDNGQYRSENIGRDARGALIHRTTQCSTLHATVFSAFFVLFDVHFAHTRETAAERYSMASSMGCAKRMCGWIWMGMECHYSRAIFG